MPEIPIRDKDAEKAVRLAKERHPRITLSPEQAKAVRERGRAQRMEPFGLTGPAPLLSQVPESARPQPEVNPLIADMPIIGDIARLTQRGGQAFGSGAARAAETAETGFRLAGTGTGVLARGAARTAALPTATGAFRLDPNAPLPQEIAQQAQQHIAEFRKREDRAPSVDEQISLIQDAAQAPPGFFGAAEAATGLFVPPFALGPAGAVERAAVRGVTRGGRAAGGRIAETAGRVLGDETGSLLPGRDLTRLGDVDKEIQRLSRLKTPKPDDVEDLQFLRTYRQNLIEVRLSDEALAELQDVEQQLFEAEAILGGLREARGRPAPRFGTAERAEFDAARRRAAEQGRPVIPRTRQLREARERVRTLRDERDRILRVVEGEPTVAPARPAATQAAETGRPVTLSVFRGSGRADPGAVLTQPEAGAILGPARYSAFQREVAEQFGPNVEELSVTLNNPLVVRTDAEWRRVTDAAGLEFPNPLRIDPQRMRRDVEQLRRYIEGLGHDGVIIRMDPRGDIAKTLRRVFGDDQVIEFRPQQAPATGPAIQAGMNIGERPAQGQLLPEALGEGQRTPLADPQQIAARQTRRAEIARGQQEMAVEAPPTPPAQPPAPPRGPEPPMGGGPPEPPEFLEFDDVVQRLNQAIKGAARPSRVQTEALRSAEVRRRAGRLAQAQAGAQGEEQVIRTRGVLGGELPRVDFEPPTIAQGERDLLFNAVNRSDKLRPFERITATDGLSKTLSGTIPTYDEMAKMERVFGPEFIGTLLSKRPWSARLWEEALDFLNIPRALISSVDMGAPLRQGRPFLTTYPKEWKDASAAMVRAFKDERFAQQVEEAIQARPLFDLSQDARLHFSPRTARATRITEREEHFMSRYSQKIPFVRMGERAHVTFLNKIRADVFDNFVNARRLDGSEPSMDELRQFARLLNWMSGRGSLGVLEQGNIPAVLNGFFFAPRFAASRFEMPFSVLSSNPTVRKRAARDLASFVGSGTMLLALLDLSGAAEVEWDPRSSDFGKVRVGNVRWDMWGGFQPVARNLAQLVTLERKTLATKELTEVDPGGHIFQFLRSKLSPSAGTAVDVWMGETFIGEEVTPGQTAFEKLVPLFIQDTMEVMEELGAIWGVAAAGPSFFGAGVQAFGDVFSDTQRAFSEIPGMRERGIQLGRVQDSIDVSPNVAGGSIDLTPEQHAKYQQIMADVVIPGMEQFIRRVEGADLSEEQERELLMDAMRTLKAQARERAIREIIVPALQGRPASTPAQPAAPPDGRPRLRIPAGALR